MPVDTKIPNPALETEIRTLFADDSGGHDDAHIFRVVRMALRLCETEGGERQVVYLAALLHDLDDPKRTGGKDGETALARALMQKYGYGAPTVQKVCAIIEKLSFKGQGRDVPETLEGKIVQDADRLDAIGAIGVARAFAYGGSRGRKMYDPDEPPAVGLTPEEYRRRKGSTVNHFYEKLLLVKDLMHTDAAKRIAEKRHRETEDFLKAFLDEWSC
ncbi:MAG: HD domain-containing protein [Clostridia bacterium]|nr:HD domain-containing protein [Clostridia bacterium]